MIVVILSPDSLNFHVRGVLKDAVQNLGIATKNIHDRLSHFHGFLISPIIPFSSYNTNKITFPMFLKTDKYDTTQPWPKKPRTFFRVKPCCILGFKRTPFFEKYGPQWAINSTFLHLGVKFDSTSTLKY